MNITLGYTYYDSPANLEYIVDWYTKHPIDIEFIIVDDGSRVHPIKKTDVPAHWRVFRVNEDIGFNNEGARNLAVCAADTKWMILLDCDRVLIPKTYDFFESIDSQELDESKIYTLPKQELTVKDRPLNNMPIDSAYHEACLLFCKKRFFSMHGYSEGRFASSNLCSYGHSESEWSNKVKDNNAWEYLVDINVLSVARHVNRLHRSRCNDSRALFEHKVRLGRNLKTGWGRYEGKQLEEMWELSRATEHMRRDYKVFEDMMLTYAWHEVLE